MNEEKIKAFEEFKKSLEGLTVDELKEKEKEICATADAIDQEIKTAEFDLDTKGYKEAATAIQYFLNLQEVQWQYTTGLMTLYDFWTPTKNPKKVSYPILDSTLRTLGALKFKGYDEWKKVVTINDYFKTTTAAYRELTEKIYDTADKHSAILDKIKIYEPIEGDVEISTQA